MLAIYTTFMAFTIQSVIWGEKGVLAYRKLENYKERLEDNEERLNEIHQNLKGKYNSYTEDRETIKTSARFLGYYQENETRLYIDGYTHDKPFYQVGRSIGAFTADPVNPLVFRIVAFLIGGITYILARARTNKQKRTLNKWY